MTGFPPPGQQTAMVRTLIVAITIMTLAIVFLFGAIVSRLLAPAGGRASAHVVDFADAPEVAITLPAGARVVETRVSADRATFVVETAAGETEIYTAPLDAFEGPARLTLGAAAQ